jgi:hypothetical protein
LACGGIPWRIADTARRCRQSARDVPKIGGALIAAARPSRRARRRHAGSPTTTPSSPNTGSDEQVTGPAATIFIDLAEWDACAHSRGGTSNSLLAGSAAKLAQRLGRIGPGDGAVTYPIPVNQRAVGDTRANAITDVSVTVDPTNAATDLSQIHTTIKQAVITQHDILGDRWALLPLTHLVPQWLAKRMISVAIGSLATVTSSNLGDIDAALNRSDGTDADYFSIGSTCSRITGKIRNRIGGVMTVLPGRINERIFISVLGDQPGLPNATDHLRDAISQALADFSLTGTFESDSLTRRGGVSNV